jgi:hypothetical protein
MSGIIEDGVTTKLLATTAVTAITSTRIYTSMAPQNAAKPYICVRRDSSEPANHSTAASGKAMARLTAICAANTYKASLELALLVEKTLNAQKGTWGSETVRHCFSRGVNDDRVFPQVADELGYPVATVSLDLCYVVPV